MTEEEKRRLAEQIFVRTLCDERDIKVFPTEGEPGEAREIHEAQMPTWLDDHASMMSIARRAIDAAEAFEQAWRERMNPT